MPALDPALLERLRQRRAELQSRLEEAMNRAQSAKARYEELEELLTQELDAELAERLRKMRQQALAENSVAVEDVRNLMARLQVHEELMAVLEGGQRNGALSDRAAGD